MRRRVRHHKRPARLSPRDAAIRIVEALGDNELAGELRASNDVSLTHGEAGKVTKLLSHKVDGAEKNPADGDRPGDLDSCRVVRTSSAQPSSPTLNGHRPILDDLRRALRHEVPSLPGDVVRISKGSATSEPVPPSPGDAPPRRTRPTPRTSRMLLRQLRERLESATPEEEDHLQLAALVLLLLGLDNSRVLWPADGAEPPPIGWDRVDWLAGRIKQLTRPTRRGTYRRRS